MHAAELGNTKCPPSNDYIKLNGQFIKASAASKIKTKVYKKVSKTIKLLRIL